MLYLFIGKWGIIEVVKEDVYDNVIFFVFFFFIKYFSCLYFMVYFIEMCKNLENFLVLIFNMFVKLYEGRVYYCSRE